MSPLWRKALPTPTPEEISREIVVKSTLTKSLGQALKTLQQSHVNADLPVVSDDSSNTVCDILEAIFIHGLKDTFVHRVSAILRGNIDKIPEPNFWPYLLVFTHKDVISQINNLQQICTDIGRCRAWLRITLNDGLLDSYLSAMTKDKKTLQYYYNHTAFLRDTEQPDILRKYIEGINILQFKLSYNIPSLNYWSSTPLMLAGIWAPPLVPEPVTTGVDIASYYIDNNLVLTPTRRRRIKPRESQLEQAYSDDNQSSLQNVDTRSEWPAIPGIGHFDSISSSPASCPDPPPPIHTYEPQGLKESSNDVIHSIEETTVKDADNSFDDINQNSSINGENMTASVRRSESGSVFASNNSMKSPSEVSRGIADGVAEAETSDDLENFPSMGNSLIVKLGWSSSFENETNDNSQIQSQANTIKESESFHTLLRNYSPVQESIIRTPNFNEIMDLMISNVNERSSSPRNLKSPVDDGSADILEYEVIPRSFSICSETADPETQAMVNLIGKIQNEKGLDSQNFQCTGCSRPIGMIYGKALVCAYDGCYYCTECHNNDEYIIPARIIHNWDFKKYKVSKHAKAFLDRIEDEPLLDIRKFNPSLYSAIEEINEILNLRMQLSYLRSYLFTCRESVLEELRKKIWPKEYLYEHIHLYALSDLLQVPGGNLMQQLTKVISFATKHVHECRLCCLKGFICEICNNQKVIYPFELDVTYRCEKCLAVFHSRCMNAQKPCPKCARREKHQGLQDYSMEDQEA